MNWSILTSVTVHRLGHAARTRLGHGLYAEWPRFGSGIWSNTWCAPGVAEQIGRDLILSEQRREMPMVSEECPGRDLVLSEQRREMPMVLGQAFDRAPGVQVSRQRVRRITGAGRGRGSGSWSWAWSVGCCLGLDPGFFWFIFFLFFFNPN